MSFTLSLTIGPVQILNFGTQYVAYWSDSSAGKVSQTLDKKWNRWLETHYSMDPLKGLGSVFLPPEALSAHPLWKKRVEEILKVYWESL